MRFCCPTPDSASQRPWISSLWRVFSQPCPLSTEADGTWSWAVCGAMYSLPAMTRSARLIFAFATTAALLPPAGARAATVDVSIRSGGNEFHPSEIVVHVGDSVRWTNDDRTLFQTDHNVMADDGSFASKQRM